MAAVGVKGLKVQFVMCVWSGLKWSRLYELHGAVEAVAVNVLTAGYEVDGRNPADYSVAIYHRGYVAPPRRQSTAPQSFT